MLRTLSVATLVLLLFAACAEAERQAPEGTNTPTAAPTATPTPAPMTVEEYAQAACRPQDLPDDATWKETVEVLEEQIERVKDIVPPAAVRDFHLAATAAIRETIDAINELDPDMNAMTNPYELADNEDYLLKAMLWQSAMDELDPGDRAALLRYGCNVEDE